MECEHGFEFDDDGSGIPCPYCQPLEPSHATQKLASGTVSNTSPCVILEVLSEDWPSNEDEWHDPERVLTFLRQASTGASLITLRGYFDTIDALRAEVEKHKKYREDMAALYRDTDRERKEEER